MTLVALLAVACGSGTDDAPAKRPFPLHEARRGFSTRVFVDVPRTPAPRPPEGELELVTFAAPLGENAAYVTPVRPGGKRPAIVWIAGGLSWELGESFWRIGPRHNDQSAAVFRRAGIATMYPSLRGSHGNPGSNECFLGEVDDIIAAGTYLRSRPDVDPARVYLGGHSTGGTLALLTAASTDQFRAVFAWGPVASPIEYRDFCPLAGPDDHETVLRSPIRFIHDIRTPTWIIEGETSAWVPSIEEMVNRRKEAPVTFTMVPGTDHFDVLRPSAELVAQQLLTDDPASKPSITIDAADVRDRLQLRQVEVRCTADRKQAQPCETVEIHTIPCAGCPANLHTTLHFDKNGVIVKQDVEALQNLLADMSKPGVDIVGDDDLVRQTRAALSALPPPVRPVCPDPVLSC